MPSIAQISVDGIGIGSIPADRYQQLRAGALRDPRVWLAQAFDLLRVALLASVATLRLLPASAFGVAVIVAMQSPDTAAWAVQQLSDPAAVGSIVSGWLRLSVLVAGCLCFLGQITGLGRPMRLRLAVDERVESQVLEILEMPARGQVTVRIVDAGGA